MGRILRFLGIAGFVVAGLAACGPTDPLTLSSARLPGPEEPAAVVFPIDGIQGEGGAALGRILSETLTRDGTPAQVGTVGNGRNPLVLGRVEKIEERGSVMWVSLGWYAMAGDGSSLGDFRHEFVASAELWRKAAPDVLQMIATEAAPKVVELVREPVAARIAEAEAERKRQIAEAEAEAKRKRESAEAEAEAQRQREMAAAAAAAEARRKRDAEAALAAAQIAPAPAMAAPEPAPVKFEPATQVASQLPATQVASQFEVLPAAPHGVKGVMPAPPLAEPVSVGVASVVPPSPLVEPVSAPQLEVLPATPANPQLGIAPVTAQASVVGHRTPEGISTKLLPPPAPVTLAGPVMLTPGLIADLVPPTVDPVPPPLPAYAPPLPAPVEAVEPLSQPAVAELPPPVIAEPVPLPTAAPPEPPASAPPVMPVPETGRVRPGSMAGTSERLAAPLPLPELPPVGAPSKPVEAAQQPKPLEVAEAAPTPPPAPLAPVQAAPVQPAPAVPQPIVDAVAGAVRSPAPAAPPLPSAAPSISVDPVVVELAFWQSIQTSKDPADFEEYLKKYPAGAFSGLARNRLASAKAEQERLAAQSATPPSVAATAEPAPVASPT